MIFLLSGEGPSDIGQAYAMSPDWTFSPGPMTHIIRALAEDLLNYEPHASAMRFISEAELKDSAIAARNRRKIILSRGAYHTRNAEILGRLALDLSVSEKDDVIAVLFRDCDRTRSAPRDTWQQKYDSMSKGFERAGFATGVSMLPRPKSEAWLICALKPQPYQACAPLEERSGNDASPNSLKAELETILAPTPVNTQTLNGLIEEGRIDPKRIDMPSFNAFKQALNDAITAAQRSPSTT